MHPGLTRRSRIHGVDLSPVFEQPAQPSLGTLVWRGTVIAFALVMISGIWDVVWLTDLTWFLAALGLGHRTLVARLAGMVGAGIVAVMAVGAPPQGVYFYATPEEIVQHLRFSRFLLAGLILGAVVGWIAGALRPRLRAWAERLEDRRA